MPTRISVRSLFALGVFLVCFLAGQLPASANWSQGFAYRRTITIDHTKVPNTNQSNFPVLISGTYSYLKTTANGGDVVNANGYDIWFSSDPNLGDFLQYERARYNASTGAVAFWVNVPTVSHTTDTVIYMFYGSSYWTTQTDPTSPDHVWGTYGSVHKAVWHLEDGSTLSATDVSGNSYNGTITGASATTGVIGGGGSFTGSSSHKITVGTGSNSLSGSYTVEMWAKPGNTSANSFVGSVSTGNYSFKGKFTGSAIHVDIGTGSSSWKVQADKTFSYSANTWHHIAFTVGSGSYAVYADGSSIGSGTYSGTALLYNSSHTLWIGGTGTSGEYFTGDLDEFRVSGSVRSGDWIATEYNNQSNPASFYSVGSATSIPGISSLWPTPRAVGASVTITGMYFGSSQGSSTVTFNGTSAGTASSWSDTSITATVPSGATTGNVVVTVSSLASNGSSLTVVSAPSITSLSPTSGDAGTSVTITGTNFDSHQGLGNVKFNGILGNVTSWSATSITAQVPPGATTGNVVVYASGVNSNGSSFTAATPSITSLSPTSGTEGTFVTITGTNFGSTQGSSTVKFNGTTATVTSWTSTSIATSVPYGATTGNVVVHAGGADSSGSSFTVVATPSITSLSPTSGNIASSVTVTGTNFGSSQGSSTLKFSGTTATSISTWTSTSITATVPAGAHTGNVVVAVASVSSNGSLFTVTGVPSITNLSPASAPIGSSVTITGTGFGSSQGGSTVTFNGTSAGTAPSWGATSITATVPSGATTGDIVVTVSGSASNGVSFSVGEAIYYYFTDALGSSRVMTTSAGTVCFDADYYPYGGEIAEYASSCGSSYKFTGKERDSESGLDNFGARYDSSQYGRFMTADLLGGQLVNPQTLNLYSYVRNNPLNFVDPTGNYTCDTTMSEKQCDEFEEARKALVDKGGKVGRAAEAYGGRGIDNGVTVHFAELGKRGRDGSTVSTLGYENGKLRANSDVTINGSLKDAAFSAAIGHEGSHVADAQDLVGSIQILDNGQNFRIGMDITQYQSEQRGFSVADSILRSANDSRVYSCGVGGDCTLGKGFPQVGRISGEIDRILAYPANGYTSNINGRPLTPTNQGSSIIPHN